MSQPTPSPRTSVNGATAGWTAPEITTLRRLYRTGEKEALLDQLPDRTWNAICLYANSTLNLVRYGYWTPKRLRVLRRHYPSKGAAYVAQLLGCKAPKVTKQASLRGIERVRPPKPTPIPKAAKPVKPKPQPKPQPQPKPVVEPVAQHQPARLNNLIAQKSLQKKKKASGAEREVPVAYIKSLPYHDPEAHQYRMGGERAVQEYRKQLQQQQAA